MIESFVAFVVGIIIGALGCQYWQDRLAWRRMRRKAERVWAQDQTRRSVGEESLGRLWDAEDKAWKDL